MSLPDGSLAVWRCKRCTYDNRFALLRCELCFSWREEDSDPLTMANDEKPKLPEIRIILIGKTGTGKSATGNMILGKSVFKSESSCSSVTNVCKLGRSERFGRRLLVVDTPALFDTGLSNDSVTKEILKCVGLSAPGPHAIVLTIAVGRFTDEEREAVSILQRIFGFEMTKFLIVVFTRKDELQRSNKSIGDLIVECPKSLQWVFETCEYRCIAFNNFAEKGERDKQVTYLLDTIDDVMDKNQGGFYTSHIFDVSEYIIQEREKEILNDKNKTAEKQLQSYSAELSKRCQETLQKNMDLEVQYKNHLRQLRRRQDQIANAYSCQRRSFQPCFTESDEIAVRDEITDVERKLIELQKERQNALTSMQGRYRDHAEEVNTELMKLVSNIREDVCREIEDGHDNMLQRIWFRLNEAGHSLKEKFKFMFDFLAKKKGK